MPYRMSFVWISVFCCAIMLMAQNKSTGKASYYSDKLHGRFMSSGIKYHKDSFTCAHRYYPLGTLLKIKNPANAKEVIVKVTDRGPFSNRLIVDISGAAARKLEIIRAGIALVEITLYQEAPTVIVAKNSAPSAALNIELIACASFPLPYWQNDSAFVTQLKKPHQHTITTRKTKSKEKDTHTKPNK